MSPAILGPCFHPLMQRRTRIPNQQSKLLVISSIVQPSLLPSHTAILIIDIIHLLNLLHLRLHGQAFTVHPLVVHIAQPDSCNSPARTPSLHPTWTAPQTPKVFCQAGWVRRRDAQLLNIRGI